MVYHVLTIKCLYNVLASAKSGILLTMLQPVKIFNITSDSWKLSAMLSLLQL